MYKRPDEQALNTARYVAILEEIEAIRVIESQTFNDDDTLKAINDQMYDLAFAALKRRNYPVSIRGDEIRRYTLAIAGKAYQAHAARIDSILRDTDNNISAEAAEPVKEDTGNDMAAEELREEVEETVKEASGADAPEEAPAETETAESESDMEEGTVPESGEIQTDEGRTEELPEENGDVTDEESVKPASEIQEEEPEDMPEQQEDVPGEQPAAEEATKAHPEGEPESQEEFSPVAITNDIPEYQALKSTVYGEENETESAETEETQPGSAEYMFSNKLPKKKMNRKRKNKNVLKHGVVRGQTPAADRQGQATSAKVVEPEVVKAPEEPHKVPEPANTQNDEPQDDASNEYEQNETLDIGFDALEEEQDDDDNDIVLQDPEVPSDNDGPLSVSFEDLEKEEGEHESSPETDVNEEPENIKDNTPVKNNTKKGNGFFSMFKKKQPEEYKSLIDEPKAAAQTAAVNVQENTAEKSNKLFMHKHVVTLRKKFGNDTRGPYTVYIWPIWIIDKFSGYQFADILTVVEGPDGGRASMVSTTQTKECYLTIDGLSFNIYGVWHTGVFESHVALFDKTESIYMIPPQDDIVTKFEPETYKNATLNMYRKDVRNVGKHFVVPFSEEVSSDEDVDIAGYIDINKTRTALTQTDEKALYYSVGNKTNVIHGRWENGDFLFDIHNR